MQKSHQPVQRSWGCPGYNDQAWIFDQDTSTSAATSQAGLAHGRDSCEGRGWSYLTTHHNPKCPSFVPLTLQAGEAGILRLRFQQVWEPCVSVPKATALIKEIRKDLRAWKTVGFLLLLGSQMLSDVGKGKDTGCSPATA